MLDPISQFKAAMLGAGLIGPEHIEHGKIQRFPGADKSASNRAGWSKLFEDGIGGVFGDYSTGLSTTWQAERETPYSQAERDAFKRQIAEARAQREAEEKARHAEAATKAAATWQAATPAPDDFPYLVRKGVKANGARLHNGALVIPLRDGNEIHSLQTIDAEGGKLFLPGGRVAGCYFAIGSAKNAAAFCIAEGFATGATIHQATGYPVAVAFNAGNLEPVARAMREKFPALPLIVCADDDVCTAGNPGLTKATAAARSVGGLLALPDFGADRPDGATDFNDLSVIRGVEAVRLAVAGLIESGEASPFIASDDPAGGDCASPDLSATDESGRVPEKTDVTDVTGVTASNDGAGAVTSADFQDVTDVTESPVTDDDHRPCFKVFDDWLALPDGRKLKPGVWFFGIKPGKGDSPPAPFQQFVCSPVKIEAVTFDGQENNFGRLLRVKNTLGRWRDWAMPMELLRGAGDDLRGELLAMGVEIDPAARNLLSQYLQSAPPKRRVNCALQVGWCGDSFVLPDAVIGPKASGVIFQSGERGHDEHTIGGTLAGWQSDISARAVGNPLLMLAVSASFAGPMLARCNGESGGIHYVGDSSTGKTTAIEVACATWGGAGFRRSWRATANGMEGAAALFNDCLLALDEISECDPKEVGAIVYALGNGRGKQRASRSGGARAVTRWRCFVLSSGERTIATTMMEGGQRAKAGQVVRLLDIPSTRRFGAWDDLQGMVSGTAFSDALKRASVTHHGHAGRAFLEKLTRDRRDFCEYLETVKALPQFAIADKEGQSKRAAGRFALIALAGEVATEYGVTKWQEGAAIEAAAECFKTWLSTRGKGNDERQQILERVSGFIERHGDSRFSNADALANDDPMRINRAGWWREDQEGRVYLFNKEGLHEALKGFDFKRALDVLQEVGAMPKAERGGERAKGQRIGGRVVRLYPVSADKLGGDHGA